MDDMFIGSEYEQLSQEEIDRIFPRIVYKKPSMLDRARAMRGRLKPGEIPAGWTPPEEFKWNDYQGEDWMSPVKSQGPCGSCWAHAGLGLIEAQLNIESNNPNLNLDLSEQFLISCARGGTCRGGSLSTLEYARNLPIPTERDYPYKYRDEACSPAAGWRNRAWSIKEFPYYIYCSDREIKYLLHSHGPVGIYINTSSSGDPMDTNHVVILTGWDDVRGVWIFKNSWGNWGAEGYGSRVYGGIDSTMAYTVQGVHRYIRSDIPESVILWDKDDNNILDLWEVVLMAHTFFNGRISREEAVEVIDYYLR